jgi:hypothetical protein
VSYPVRFSVDYGPKQGRLGAFFRWILALPHLIVVGLLQYVAAIIAIIAWFAILFTGRYPRGLFEFQAGYLRWYARTNAYIYYLTGRYPPFGFGSSADGYAVRLEVDSAGRLSRLSTFFRAFLMIPAFVVLYLVLIVGVVVGLISWIVVTVLGRLPQGLHDVNELVVRYGNRVHAYQLLITDRFPWFQPEDGVPPAAGVTAGAVRPAEI